MERRHGILEDGVCRGAVNDLRSGPDGSRLVTSSASSRMNFSLGYQFDEGYHAVLKSQREEHMDDAKAERVDRTGMPLSESIVYHGRYREWSGARMVPAPGRDEWWESRPSPPPC
jgi:hypothetical protein